MISGRQTLSEIEGSIQDLRQQEQQLLSDMEQINAHHARLLDQRTAAFRELAEVRARNAVTDGVINQADALQHRVASLLQARQTTIDSLKFRDGDAHTKRASFSQTAETLRGEIEALEKRLDIVAADARQQLAKEAGFAALTAKRDAAEQIHEQAEKKTKQAETDRQRKGEAYEGDRLFMYLWERHYGTGAYKQHWLIRTGDDWVARLIGYHDARANYAILNEIPERLHEHVKLLSEQLTEADAHVEEAEARRINELAGIDLKGALSDARNRQAENNKALETTEAEISEISLQLNRYAEGLDDSFEEAVELSAQFLEHEDYQRLIVLARKTSEPTDDRIVARIGEIDRKASDLQRNSEQRRRDLDRVSHKRKELLDVGAKFRREYYDDPASEFEPDDIAGTILRELIRGGITAADYWARSQRRHSWKGRPADPYRRQAGFPPFGGGWGRGNSGGRFETGGGF